MKCDTVKVRDDLIDRYQGTSVKAVSGGTDQASDNSP